MTNFRFNLLMGVVALLISSVARAGKVELKTLLRQPSRPTIEQILQAGGGEILEKNPYADLDIAAFDSKYPEQKRDLPHLAHVIAFMEGAYPGAIWAPLGRDAVIFGDLLDAFYLSLGQPGRVSRINASGASFSQYQGPDLDAMRVRLLESAGLDLQGILNGRPFVGIDCTSFSSSSQSANLMRAAYDRLQAAGVNEVELIPHLGFLALNSGSTPMTQQTIDDYFIQAKFNASEHKGLASALAIETGSWNHSLPWHDTFGPLIVRPDGKVEGPPGAAPASLEVRRAILAHQIEIIQDVSRPAFVASVQEQAKQLGYNFPLSAEASLERAKKVEQIFGERIERVRARAEHYVEDRAQRLESLSAVLEGTGHLSYTVLNQAIESELRIRDRLERYFPEQMRPFNYRQTLTEVFDWYLRKTRELKIDVDFDRVLTTLLKARPGPKNAMEGIRVIAKAYGRDPDLTAFLKRDPDGLMLNLYESVRYLGSPIDRAQVAKNLKLLDALLFRRQSLEDREKDRLRATNYAQARGERHEALKKRLDGAIEIVPGSKFMNALQFELAIRERLAARFPEEMRSFTVSEGIATAYHLLSVLRRDLITQAGGIDVLPMLLRTRYAEEALEAALSLYGADSDMTSALNAQSLASVQVLRKDIPYVPIEARPAVARSADRLETWILRRISCQGVFH